MILQALCEYYDILAADEECDIPQEGYSNAKISYALNISKEGELKSIISLKVPTEKGNKEIYRMMTVPEQHIKAGKNPPPYFLSENSSFIFGMTKDKKNPIEIKENYFEAFKQKHFEILGNCEDEGAKAILNFLNNWNIQNAEETLKFLTQDYENLLQGANFIFKLDGEHEYIHQGSAIRQAWENYKNKDSKEKQGFCLIKGNETPIARTHPKIKGVRDAQQAGGSIVAFNERSFESYGKEQSYNAPVGIESAFKYTTVLNFMLQNNSKQKIQIGDATTVFWAESTKKIYNSLFNFGVDASIKSEDKKTEEEKIQDDEAEAKIKDCFKALKEGRKLSEVDPEIDDETKFYILGLSPNNARVSIRIFHGDTFGNFMKNLTQHHKDLELEGGRFPFIPIWIILEETTIKNSSKDKPTPLLSGRIMEAIVKGGKYPDDLYAAMIRRIRAEQDINHTRAAVIKAYLVRKARINNKQELQEVLKLSLNEETTNTAYRLGRLFALLERTQENALGDINATIKDRYFPTASATPGVVFPTLLKLNVHHLAKLDSKGKWLEIEIGKVLDEIQAFPTNLNMENQGLFILGYYHQRQSFFKKKEVKEVEPALAN